VVGLDVRRGNRGDLQGKVCLNDVWLARLPRITVSTNSPCNVYRDKDDVVVRCELSGIREQNPEIRFQLLDASSKELHGGSVHLNGRLIEEDTKKASDIVDGIGNSPKGYEGVTDWRPKIPCHGFYGVVVTMLSSDKSGKQTDEERKMDRRLIWLAVVPPLPMAPEGDFGWSLPDVDRPLGFQELTGLLPNVGINWVKLPAWYDVAQPRRGDEIIRFVEMLGASNIEVVGVIDRPPTGSDVAERMGTGDSIADLLAFDQAIWLSALDPVMSRLSMRLRYWQLGSDQDTSLVGFPKLAQRISEIRERLFRFGQQVKLGLPWVWDGASPTPGEASWGFEQLTPDPALTLEQFEAFVSRPRRDSMLRWITIEPPPHPDDATPARLEDLNSRATEFVRKLVAAKEHGVDGIFISRPFDDKNGLMRANGMPAELLLPWRTTAAMLGGTKYLGSVQLPGGSENRNFLRPDGQVVMVVWSATPTQETLFLGTDARQIDVWGRCNAARRQRPSANGRGRPRAVLRPRRERTDRALADGAAVQERARRKHFWQAAPKRRPLPEFLQARNRRQDYHRRASIERRASRRRRAGPRKQDPRLGALVDRTAGRFVLPGRWRGGDLSFRRPTQKRNLRRAADPRRLRGRRRRTVSLQRLSHDVGRLGQHHHRFQVASRSRRHVDRRANHDQ